FALWMAAVGLCSCDEPAPPSARDDPRLARVVRFTECRAYLGEALEQLTRDTGVSLRISDRGDPASGLELMVWVSQRPLEQVMAAVTGLLSTPYDRWHWQRDGTGGQSSYTLVHEPAMLEAAGRARRDIAQRFSEDAWAAYRASKRGV